MAATNGAGPDASMPNAQRGREVPVLTPVANCPEKPEEPRETHTSRAERRTERTPTLNSGRVWCPWVRPGRCAPTQSSTFDWLIGCLAVTQAQQAVKDPSKTSVLEGKITANSGNSQTWINGHKHGGKHGQANEHMDPRYHWAGRLMPWLPRTCVFLFVASRPTPPDVAHQPLSSPCIWHA